MLLTQSLSVQHISDSLCKKLTRRTKAHWVNGALDPKESASCISCHVAFFFFFLKRTTKYLFFSSWVFLLSIAWTVNEPYYITTTILRLKDKPVKQICCEGQLKVTVSLDTYNSVDMNKMWWWCLHMDSKPQLYKIHNPCTCICFSFCCHRASDNSGLSLLTRPRAGSSCQSSSGPAGVELCETGVPDLWSGISAAPP